MVMKRNGVEREEAQRIVTAKVESEMQKQLATMEMIHAH